MVYEFVFEGNVVHKFSNYHSKNFDRQPALLCVNKQVYDEAAPVFYQTTSFNFTFGPSKLVRWLRKMPAEHCHAIKCIKCLSSTRNFGAAAQRIEQFKELAEEAGIKLNDGALWVLVRGGWDWYGRVSIWVNELGHRERAER